MKFYSQKEDSIQELFCKIVIDKNVVKKLENAHRRAYFQYVSS